MLCSGTAYRSKGSRHTMPCGPLDSDGRAFDKGLRHAAVSAAPRTPLSVAVKPKVRMSLITGSVRRRSKEAVLPLPWLHSATGRCYPKPPKASNNAPPNLKKRSDGCLLRYIPICDRDSSVLPAPSGTPVVNWECALHSASANRDRLQIANRKCSAVSAGKRKCYAR